MICHTWTLDEPRENLNLSINKEVRGVHTWTNNFLPGKVHSKQNHGLLQETEKLRTNEATSQQDGAKLVKHGIGWTHQENGLSRGD